MAPTRKRKHDASDSQQTSKHASTPSIADFGTVSKSSVPVSSSKKLKTSQNPGGLSILSEPATTASTKCAKRKRSSEPAADGLLVSQVTDVSSEGISKQFAMSPGSPRTKRAKKIFPPSPAETPSKKAAALFDKLKIQPISFSLGHDSAGIDTPPDTPEEQKLVHQQDWPAELQDLCDLHAAFLTALSLYYAHNGTSSPVGVRSLLDMISKNWKKRSVNLLDMQRLLAIGHAGRAEFTLEDYSRAGICMNRAQARGRGLQRAASYVDEDDLNMRFQEALQAAWHRRHQVAEKEDDSPSTFLAQLPIIEIVANGSVENASSLFARGQQRLADIKAAQAGANATSESQTGSIMAEHRTTKAVQSRGTSLLDRVLARQASTASMPAGPTKAQLERKAALHRIEDIARALSLLVSVKPRATVSMHAAVQQLQQSLRNPISREEVERCLELMTKEITPGFVNVITTGSVKGVVVIRAARLDVAEIRVRVAQAVA
ncbi:hypothetical protein LTR78_001514 [Recurvomyces mirabilis]|uniref:DNA replication factor Cdt1 C-terminal domain-containing protein n=1 Tax=Recurvomyces mirabilis TaxID=574656 RepID=A0AAE0WVQ1_9PEZI|nr:hypothetical protein LTR78_001514 [Recurvomyces mirabilis]KAK5161493.1 hypothetical protein LTS14_001289 [Recurvomyces mirabilis]